MMNQEDEAISRARPILVVGMNRSGTKWLSNLLGRHPGVSAIQSDYHCGQIETNLLCDFDKKFNLRLIDDFIAAVEAWSQTDFFRVAGVDKRKILAAQPRPTNAIDLLRLLFDEVARRDGTSHFLLKAGPTQAWKALARWDDAQVIVIERSFHETLTSTLQLKANKGRNPSVFESTYSYVAQKKVQDRLCRQYNPLCLHYDELKKDSAHVLSEVCDYLSLPFTQALLDVNYSPNTSFAHGQHRSVRWAAAHPRALHLLRGMLSLIPLRAMTAYARIKAALKDAPAGEFIRGSYSMRQAEILNRNPGNVPGALLPAEQQETTIDEATSPAA